MKMNGVTVYLKANTNFLFTRLQTRKAKRPLIAHMSDDELKKYIRKKLTEREAIYLQADIIYNAVDVDVALLQMMIINYLRG
jgi:shikimate kinase